MGHRICFGSILVSAMLFVSGCSRAPADAVIATEIKAKFFSDPMVKTADLSVTVNKGEVTLAGTVGSEDAQLRAFKLALETEGVRKLNDQMSVFPPAERSPMTGQLSTPRHQEGITAVSTPSAETPQNPPPQDQVQAVREIVQPPAPSEITVRVEAPRAQLAVAPLATEPVGEYTAPADGPVTEIIAPSVAETWKAPSHAPVELLAAGATAPAALLQKWMLGFRQADPQTRITYQAIGSGGAIRMLLQGSTDLAAIEMPMTDEQLSKIPNYRILHFPAAIWGVVPVFNIDGGGQALNVSGEVLAAIFSGRISRWDDPAIGTLNRHATLPAADITAVHRSDGAGTTFVFTDYLSSVSPDWKMRIGAAPSVNWMVGLAGKGNEGVAGLVKQTPNSIGYVDLAYALQNGMNRSSMRNRTGNFVKASAHSLTTAAANMSWSIPPDFRASIVNAPGGDAYPIASLMWLVTPDRFLDTNKKDATRSFLEWMLTRGQYQADQVGYAPLPIGLAQREQGQIGRIH